MKKLIGIYSPAMQSGKSTVSNMLTEQMFGRTMAFAGPFYDFVVQVAAPFIGSEAETWAWMKDKRKDNEPIPGLGVTLRSMLQTIGTKWGRECVNAQLWTMLARKNAEAALKSYSVIFDDMRFPNEFDMIRDMGGTCVKLVRPGAKAPNGAIAEGLLDRHAFDWTIVNDKDLTDLSLKVGSLVRYLERE
jgi:hypothetical protein